MDVAEEKRVEMKVQMECACIGCERRVRKSVKGMEGVRYVHVDREQGKLTVIGFVDPNHVLERVRCRTRKKVEFWPEPEPEPEDVPYDVVFLHPHSPEPWDHNALPVNVHNLHDQEASRAARASFFNDVDHTMHFSDENPNACTIM